MLHKLQHMCLLGQLTRHSNEEGLAAAPGGSAPTPRNLPIIRCVAGGRHSRDLSLYGLEVVDIRP